MIEIRCSTCGTLMGNAVETIEYPWGKEIKVENIKVCDCMITEVYRENDKYILVEAVEHELRHCIGCENYPNLG